MAYGYIKKNAVQATNINALNRRGVYSDDVENGSVFNLATYSSTAGESNVFTATLPATGSLSNLWMAGTEKNNTISINGKKYKGLTQDPRDFINLAGEIIDLFQPQVGDIIEMTSDAVGGTQSTNTFVVATNGQAKLQWSAAAVSGLSLKLKDTQFVSLGNGAIGSQRINTFRFEVVAVA